MFRNDICARHFVSKKEFAKIVDDLNAFALLDDDTKKDIQSEYNEIISTETPHLALKRHGTIPNDDWKETLTAQNIRSDTFFKKHPSFYLNSVEKEFRSIVGNKNAIFVNSFRKGREKANVVNVISNNDYLVFIYNRLINSTQTYVVFSAIPLAAIEKVERFSFLNDFVPGERHDFCFETEISEFDDPYLGKTSLTSTKLIIGKVT